MFKLLVVALLVAFVSSKPYQPYEIEFQTWMTKFNKVYATDVEYESRFVNYLTAKIKIAELNAESLALNSTATFGPTSLADLSDKELSALYGIPAGYTPKMSHHNQLAEVEPTGPAQFDWRTLDRLTAVKDQGQCGSCWAFSCTESIESVYMIAKNIGKAAMPPLAPQQIVDCDKNGAAGCNGGDLPTCYNYVKAEGLEKESDYPYHARDQTCAQKPALSYVKISGFKYVIPSGSNNEPTMTNFVSANSPVSILVDASKWSYYTGGVLKSTQCSHNLDHAVQIIGYDTSSASPYWIVRNSWGAGWGLQGYIQLEYNKNTCGLTSEVTVPTL